MTHACKLVMSASALALAVSVATPVAAAEIFKDRTITVQVPSGSGGTYHVYVQTVQRLIGKFIPGNPRTIVQNQPGAGGAKSAAYMYNVAPKDGTYIAMIAPGTISVPLVRKVKFDARKFQWLGSLAARASAIWVWHTYGINNLDGLKNSEVTIATSGFASAGSVFPRLANEVLGTKMKLIYGYKGGGAINVAVERKETQGRWNWYSGFTGVRPEWITGKKVVPLLALGPRHAKLAGVPHIEDLLKSGTVERKMYDVLGMNFEVGQAFYVPPGTPKSTVGILKKAFAAMVADPGTEKEILRRRIEFSPKSAAEVEAAVAKGFKAATPDVVKRLRGIFKKKKKS